MSTFVETITEDARRDPASFRGKGIDALLYRHIWDNGRAKGFDWAEAGWILEDNQAMINGLNRMGFEVYKTYRIYERPI